MIAFEISGIRDILAAAERNCVKLTRFLLQEYAVKTIGG